MPLRDDRAMYLVLIGWIYVALMMAAAEATAANGTVLGAIFTFALYGLLPVGLIGYLLDAPRRRNARKAAEQAALLQAAPVQPSVDAPDAGSESPGATDAASPAGAVSPVREKH